MWQQSLIGIGPTGVDKGKGGRFLLLPPDYQGEPPAGYFTAKSPTYGVWFGVRGFLVKGKPDQAVVLMKTMRIYPLARASDPDAMIFLNGSGKSIDTIFPDTYEYFESLAVLVEKEPVRSAKSGLRRGPPTRVGRQSHPFSASQTTPHTWISEDSGEIDEEDLNDDCSSASISHSVRLR